MSENAVLISPDTLAIEAGSNQRYRIDVLRATAPLDSVDPADVLATVFGTQPGDPNVREPFPLSSDLSAFAGQTVRLRRAQVSTDFYFSASADDVRIVSVADLRTSPATLAFGRQDIDDGPAAGQTSRLINDSPDPVTLSGTQPESTLSPGTLAFGSQAIDDGATASQTSTVTNAGVEPVVLSGLTLSEDGHFARLTGESGDCAADTVLAAGETCDVRVRFDGGVKAATLTVASNTPEHTVALTGTGSTRS